MFIGAPYDHIMRTSLFIVLQGGEAVILELPNSPGVEFYEALAEARRKCNGRIFFYFSDDLELKEIKK